jgi:hypothetical protein
MTRIHYLTELLRVFFRAVFSGRFNDSLIPGPFYAKFSSIGHPSCQF